MIYNSRIEKNGLFLYHTFRITYVRVKAVYIILCCNVLNALCCKKLII